MFYKHLRLLDMWTGFFGEILFLAYWRQRAGVPWPLTGRFFSRGVLEGVLVNLIVVYTH